MKFEKLEKAIIEIIKEEKVEDKGVLRERLMEIIDGLLITNK